MLITIHGFPAKTKYADVKTLIKEECKLDDFMLGNLMGDSDGTKKIRIGLSDDNEGYMVLKRLDGYRMGGNFILKTVPVGKSSLNSSTQNTFDTHPNFCGNTEGNNYPNPSRNDFQPRGVYQNQPSNAYGIRGPHGMGGQSHGPPQNDMNAGRPLQWAPNTGPWASVHQSNMIANQLPQDNFNYPQQVIPHFEQQSRQLRSIETVEVGGSQLPIQGRYQPPGSQFQQDNPITIMKENFQGPTAFNISNPTGGQQQPRFPQQTLQPWEHHGQQTKSPQFTKTNPINYERPDSFKEYDKTGRTGYPLRSSPTGRRISPAGRRTSPPGRRFSPSERKISPPGRRNSPPGRRFSPSGRRFSPPGKRISPTGRRISPTGRRISPTARRNSPTGRRISPTGRRISPFGRRISPSARPVSPGRRVSPTARRFSPSGRRISPSDRRMAGPHSAGRRESPPPKMVSPGRRVVSSPHRRPSPSRRESPNRVTRFSPGGHHPDKPGKHVRPAYEPPHQAPNQAIYPGGFRPNIHENVQHSGMRQDTQRPQWQRGRDEYIKTQNEETRGTTRSEIPRDRNPQKIMESQRQLPSLKSRSPVHRERSPIRRERSPVRRERSPIRDRFKRHSPSPRSPRRSWAFEKRHSPDMGDAPPPPTWPGQKREDVGAAQGYRQARPILARDPIDQPQPFRPTFQKDEQHQPKWERAIEDDHNRRPVNQDNKFYKPPRELDRERNPSHTDRYVREPHFSPREGFGIDHRDDYRNPDTHPKKPYIQREDSLKRADDRRRDERRRREESPHLDIRENLLKIDTIDKDFEDIYQRTLQFKKKAEEMRRSANRRGISEDVGHHSEREREEDRYEGDYGEDENRSKERSRQDYRRVDDGKAQNRSEEEHKFKRTYLDQSVKGKRTKAIDEITSKIMERHPEFNQLKGEQKQFFTKELNEAISRLIFDMFGNKDISFIEIIVKYQAKYNVKEEEKLLQNIVESLPSQYRIMKRHASESCGTPAKISKSSPSTGMNQEAPSTTKFMEPNNWTMLEPPKLMTPLSILGAPPVTPVMTPIMVPSPFSPSLSNIQQNQIYTPMAPVIIPENTDDFSDSLYLCKEDFGPFAEGQPQLLKNFIVSQIMHVSETSHGWAPDVTIKGLQSLLRYEILCNDNQSRDWLINLDFSEFRFFNVLVYTKEELWYERAAIWLPGHSKYRKIEPLEKLKLQNKKLEDVDIRKWKLVKKIVTTKGTRLYVDMPPSSARALNKHKMLLSYELQKVNVFLKAVAVDKDAFDAGMRENSITDPANISQVIQESPIPSLTYDPSIVKITLKGVKQLQLAQARKIKEVIIYHLFKYHQEDGICRTDFIKHGYLPPNYFGIVPEVPESKRWLLARQFGTIGRQQIVVLGDDDDNTCFFRMVIVVPTEYQSNTTAVIERLKQSNQGVKGLNFNLWKPIKPATSNKYSYEVDVDLESLEAVIRMDYQLDYVDQRSTRTVVLKSKHYSAGKLEELVQKYKSEMTDIYDDATMDLDSDTSENNDVICLD